MSPSYIVGENTMVQGYAVSMQAFPYIQEKLCVPLWRISPIYQGNAYPISVEMYLSISMNTHRKTKVCDSLFKAQHIEMSIHRHIHTHTHTYTYVHAYITHTRVYDYQLHPCSMKNSHSYQTLRHTQNNNMDNNMPINTKTRTHTYTNTHTCTPVFLVLATNGKG